MAERGDPYEHERELVRRLNTASAADLADLLYRPDPEEERILRAHLGDGRYERMHALALRRSVTRAAAPRGNVVVIHGIMGGELTAVRPNEAKQSKIWLDYFQLFLGRFMWFRLQPDGVHETDPRQSLRASGILQKYYGELLLRLSLNWNAIPFWFDWRKDIYRAAVELGERAAEAFGRDTPFHIIAHSMGGLVARTFIRRNREAWKRMQNGDAKRGGRLIMLGTPNFGSFVVPQIITGLEGILRKIDRVDTRNDLGQYIAVANTFPGNYQMMPSLTKMPDMKPLYEANRWRPIDVPQPLLDAGRAFHSDIDPVRDKWMTYIAGYGHETLNGIRDWNRLHEQRGYTSTSWDGDGRVPHKLGLLGEGRVFYVREAHGDLPANEAVQIAAERLLELGPAESLGVRNISDTLPARRGAQTDPDAAAAQREEAIAAEIESLDRLANRARGTRAIPETGVESPTEESQRAEELLVAGWLGRGPYSGEPAEPAASSAETAAPSQPASIQVGIYRGNIDSVHLLPGDANPDAVAVGLYIGVRPNGAARVLDRAVSECVSGSDGYFLTQMLERGVIQAGLGQPFILPDPRTDAKPGAANRVIALAGMGLPGRFGAPEATVMARELCWTLGRIQKRHLATVLIGSGVGNLSIHAAIESWMRGIARAQAGMPPEARLERVTFIERDRARAKEMEDALQDMIDRLRSIIAIEYTKLTDSRDAGIPKRLMSREVNQVPARVTFTHDEKGYRFGSITRTAALPERSIPLDPSLVDEANQLLALQETAHDQMTWGRFLERLLIPADFRTELQSDEPLVMMLDSTTASIHWEMMAQPGFDDAGRAFEPNAFLGTARGLTRQLRTTFAPPPEPPPPENRSIRVLIIADPAPHDRLPGAQFEGTELARLFRQYNERLAESRLWSNEPIRVETLLGPVQARRAQVMKRLMTVQYDVVHFAGHCFYNASHPDRSGWIFGENELLTANEMNRIDRVPPFVFSNACESGKTPASPELPQSFAEAFFGRGVTNFVCTAWPISDRAAIDFALAVYSTLLGMKRGENGEWQLEKETLPMWEAMRAGRLALAESGEGRLTWGAYQHYGNPYYRLITRERRPRNAPGRSAKPAAARRSASKRRKGAKKSRG